MNIEILAWYSKKKKAGGRSFHYGREERNKPVWRSQKTSRRSDKSKCMSFLSHPEWKCCHEGVSQASLALSAFSQAQGWSPWWGNPLSDREKKKEEKKQSKVLEEGEMGGGGARQADDVSNLYLMLMLIIRFSLFSLLSIWDTSFHVCPCHHDGLDTTASHTSDGHIHETDGHKATTSSTHGEGRKGGGGWCKRKWGWEDRYLLRAVVPVLM